MLSPIDYANAERVALAAVRQWAKGRAGIPASVELADLEQEARVAVWRARERFQAGRGVKFSTYARDTAVGAVRNFVRDQCVTTNRRYAEIAAGVAERTEQDMLPASLNTPIFDEGAPSSLLELLPDHGLPLADTVAERVSVERLWREIAWLPHPYAETLWLRFAEGLSLPAAGRRAGITAPGLQKRERRAIQALRKRLALALWLEA